MVTLGGNLRLKKTHADYDLLELPTQERFQTVAAEFYRRTLRSQVEGDALMEEPPSKEEGKKVVVLEGRTSE